MPNASHPINQIMIPQDLGQIRFDRWLSAQFPDYSRSEIQQWIKNGLVLSNGKKIRPGSHAVPGMKLDIQIPLIVQDQAPQAEDLPLEILYEDADLIAINKRTGQVVHPAPGHLEGTVLNAMLHHFPDMADAGETHRPGLVHRLDVGTSGVMLFARNSEALENLQNAFKARQVSKMYHCICHGIPDPYQQTCTQAIGRHPVHRKKRAVDGLSPRDAITHFKLLKGVAGGNGGLLEVKIETGRTHQIRVHLSHVGHPVIGDTVYAGKQAQFSAPWPKAERVMLHAKQIEFPHPKTGALLKIEAEYSSDMESYLSLL
ncbi:RluA family pseudouridine synthase [Kiritimatiellota bacterium B12222]|nr:RluA family pseudouridine synthase [Kiritimatiellota bacterium B12222]